MAEGPNPAGENHANTKLPYHRPAVKATPKVRAVPNTVKDTNLTRAKGSSNTGGPGGTRAR